MLPKIFVRYDKYKCLEVKNKICDHNKFDILNEELGNGEFSVDSIVENFINTTNSVTKHLSITLSTDIEKRCLKCALKIYCLQKVKHIKYKQIEYYNSSCDSNEFAKIVDSNN